MEYLLEAPIIYETDEVMEVTNPAYLHAHVLSNLFKSRYTYSHDKLGMDIKKMLEEGYGFYVTLAEVEVHKSLPISKTPVHVKSMIKRYLQVASSSRVHIPFEMTDVGSQELIASGIMECAVVDTKVAKSRLLPIADWKFFSHKLNADGPALIPYQKELFVKPKIIVQESTERISRKVQDQEIDMYNHVGTTNYIRYIYDTLKNPLEYKKSFTIFKKSLLKGDEFVILKQDEGTRLLFEIRDPELKITYTTGFLEKLNG